MSNKIKKPRIFLPILKTTNKHIINRERVSLLTSNVGSVVIETALIIPFFIGIFVMLFHFILLVNKQNNVSNILYDNAQKISKSIGIYDIPQGVDIGYKSISDGYIELKSKYKFDIPLLMWSGHKLNVKQVIIFRKWSGESIVKNENIKWVYITENGKVYHTNIDCTYIKLIVNEVVYKELKGKYDSCKICVHSQVDNENKVYITQNGKKYHIKRECSAITRVVKKININDIGERNLCSRCAK